MRKIFCFHSLVLIAGLFVSISVSAQKTWDGGGGTPYWGNANNWSPDGVPTASDDVVINSAGINPAFYTVALDVTAVAKSLTLTGGSTLDIQYGHDLTITNGGSVTVNTGCVLTFSESRRILGGGNGANGIQITIASGASLGTANEDGFTTGGIDATLTGSFGVNIGNFLPIYSTGASYSYYRVGNQSTGNGVTGAHNLELSGSGVKTFTNSISISNYARLGVQATVAGQPLVYQAGAKLIYDGFVAQTTSDIEFPSSSGPDKLDIKNPFGVTLHAARTIPVELSITGYDPSDGSYLTTTSTNLLTIGSGGTFPNPGNLDRFVNGPLARVGITDFTFWVGKAGSGLRPLYFRNAEAGSNPATITTIEFFRAQPPYRTSLESSLTQISNCEYWAINTNTDKSFETGVSWGANSPCNGLPYVTDISTLRVAAGGGGTWYNFGNNGHAGNTTQGVLYSIGMYSSASHLALGSSSALTNPLPVKFGPIRAYARNNGVQVDWTTYSAFNLDKYVIERSADGSQFTPIGDVAGQNVSVATHYGFFDPNPISGVSFYRLRNLDLDGKSGYSQVVRVSLNGTGTDIVLYPNPVTGESLVMQMGNLPKGNYYLRIFNSAGQEVYNRSQSHPGGMVTQTINLPGTLQSGIYHLRISSESLQLNKIFLVQ